MKIANKLSPATKMVLIVLYTFVLFAASIFIINLSNFETSKENKYDYKNISRDENIQIVTKLVESRTKGDVASNKREKSSWKIDFQVAKYRAAANTVAAAARPGWQDYSGRLSFNMCSGGCSWNLARRKRS